jgi:hypothetical protein
VLAAVAVTKEPFAVRVEQGIATAPALAIQHKPEVAVEQAAKI